MVARRSRNQAMRRFRFTIGSLLITVVVLAIGFAAILQSTDLWDSCIFTLTLGILLTSILLMIHGKGSARAFWLGLALFGGVYFIFSLVPSIESRMVTRRLLVYLDSEVGRGNARIWDLATGKVLGIVTNQNLLRIGHCILALFFGWCGGLLSRAIHDRSR
jgi:hypothetical protein